MKKIIFTALLAVVGIIGYGQTTEDSNDEIFHVVEQMPEFPGGDEAFFKYLGDNLQYPIKAREAGIEGKIIVEFVVEADGSITNVLAHYLPRRNDSQNQNASVNSFQKELENEAIRVIKAMPKWIPGKQRGKNVRVAYRCPVTFSLN